MITNKALNNGVPFRQVIHEVIRGYDDYSSIPFNIIIVNSHDNRLLNKSDKIPAFFDNIVQRETPSMAGTIVVSPNQYENQSELLLLRPIPHHSLFADSIAALLVEREDIQQYMDQLTFEKEQFIWLF